MQVSFWHTMCSAPQSRPMTDSPRTDPDATRHALDRLSSHFASLITRADAPELDRIVIDILEQIAHALDVDHVSLLRATGGTATPAVLKSWRRPGVDLEGAGGQPGPVTIAQGHMCALAVATWRSPAE